MRPLSRISSVAGVNKKGEVSSFLVASGHPTCASEVRLFEGWPSVLLCKRSIDFLRPPMVVNRVVDAPADQIISLKILAILYNKHRFCSSGSSCYCGS
jgi:hypothetical protein